MAHRWWCIALATVACSSSSPPPAAPPAAVTVEGAVAGEDGAPIAGAAVSLAIGDASVDAASDDGGHFRLGLTDAQYAALPAHFFVVATASGVAVGAVEIAKPDGAASVLTAAGPVVLPKDGDGRIVESIDTKTTHLGDSSYMGAENGQFQLTGASSTARPLTLTLPSDFDPKGTRSAKVEILARGIQTGAVVRFKGVAYPFDDSPADGSAAPLSVDLPAEALTAGANAFSVESLAFDTGDYDDFEYAYVRVSLESFGRPVCMPGVFTKTSAPPDPTVKMNDKFLSTQTSLDAIGAPEAWTTFFHPQTGIKATTRILVAIPDTGVDMNHPDFKDQDRFWNNPSPGSHTGLFGTPITGDLHGYNFVTHSGDVSPVPQPDSNCIKYLDHGTFVAGILGAATNNGVGVASVAVNVARLMPLTIASNCDDPNQGVANASFQNALAYAAQTGVRVINMSVVPTDASAIDENVKYVARAEAAGAFVTVAAGNQKDDLTSDAWSLALSSIAGVVVVGGTDLAGDLWTDGAMGSASGRNVVEIAAPAAEVNDPPAGGTGIYSTANTTAEKYGHGEGTSFSAPTVAAAGVLAIAFVESRGSTLIPPQVECFLEETARIEPKLVTAVQRGRMLDLVRLARQLNAQFPPK